MKIIFVTLFYATFGMFVFFPFKAFAINTVSTGWQLSPNTSTNIDVSSIGGDCKLVATPNDGKTRFVPTKTVAEWNAFKAAAPGLGITLTTCLIVWNGVSWYRIAGNQSAMTVTQAKSQCTSFGKTLATSTTWSSWDGTVSTGWAHSGTSWSTGNPTFIPTASEAAMMGGYSGANNSLWSAWSSSWGWSSWCAWIPDSSTIASSSCSTATTWTSHTAMWIPCM